MFRHPLNSRASRGFARRLIAFCLPVLACAGICLAQQQRDGQDDLQPRANRPASGQAPMLAPPPADVVRSRVLAWVAEKQIADQALLEAVGQRWALGDEPKSAEELLALVVETFSLVDPVTRAFVEACSLERAPLLPPEAAAIERQSEGPFYLANMALFHARYLVHRRMFEEALDVLDRIVVEEAVDPALLLFCKAVCEHHLLMKDAGLATIERLLKNTQGVPLRYATVAQLMQHDLELLQEKTLDEVSRKMSDVERRLNLARAGQKVQKREEEIIATLDEIIKKIEDSQGGGGGAGGAGNRSNAPAQDSVVKGSTAPGTVDPKKLKVAGDWGNLPPKERAKAKEDIARKFGAHYAEAVEKFNTKQAARPGRADK